VNKQLGKKSDACQYIRSMHSVLNKRTTSGWARKDYERITLDCQQ